MHPTVHLAPGGGGLLEGGRDCEVWEAKGTSSKPMSTDVFA